jgi:hypothetical protein
MSFVDRCDRAECGAQALVQAQFTTGPLFFCGHHWREVADAATQAALSVVDEQTASSHGVPRRDPQPVTASDAR